MPINNNAIYALISKCTKYLQWIDSLVGYIYVVSSVVQVADTSTLFDVLSDNEATYDFCMCNPPFFGSNFEAWGMLTSRTTDRPDPSSVSTASPVESIVAGGEVEFVKRMINDSVALKGRIR